MCFSLSDGSQQLRGEPQEKLLKVRGEMRSFPHWRMLGGALWKLGMPTMLKRSLLPFCLLRTWDAGCGLPGNQTYFVLSEHHWLDTR